eukprot:939891-Amphidinium_carterae.2
MMIFVSSYPTTTKRKRSVKTILCPQWYQMTKGQNFSTTHSTVTTSMTSYIHNLEGGDLQRDCTELVSNLTQLTSAQAFNRYAKFPNVLNCVWSRGSYK